MLYNPQLKRKIINTRYVKLVKDYQGPLGPEPLQSMGKNTGLNPITLKMRVLGKIIKHLENCSHRRARVWQKKRRKVNSTESCTLMDASHLKCPHHHDFGRVMAIGSIISANRDGETGHPHRPRIYILKRPTPQEEQTKRDIVLPIARKGRCNLGRQDSTS